MAITGNLFIGSQRPSGTETYQGFDAATGKALAGNFAIASAEQVDAACELATAAFDSYSSLPNETRAAFLDEIANRIEALGDELLERAQAESGLPAGRITGERGRTMGQLRLFANEVRDGAWMGIRIDPAMPERQPIPRSDVRMRRVALGPVGVFGASNFPLAFSVAGGDTASALAAGCPVIVKAHPAHPGTCELIASAIAAAVKACDLHEGVFSMIADTGHSGGIALVNNSNIKAVGFTGSRAGGLALMKAAAARPEPIPVYAEMSAVNPVVLLPGALKENAAALGEAYAGSLSVGAGQFCTNPGIALAINCPELDTFIDAATQAVAKTAPQVMLTSSIRSAYETGRAAIGKTAGVETISTSEAPSNANTAPAQLFITKDDALEASPNLTEEVFGACSVLVRCKDTKTLKDALTAMEGQLTATMHLTDDDHPIARDLLPILEKIAGRIIANGWPTGVEVCHAMVHGGPFPSTSDARTTSVGSLAIDRFLRPVCYQDFPDALLPTSLKGDGESGALKRVDGTWRA